MVIFWFKEIRDPAQDTWKAGSDQVESMTIAEYFYWNCQQRVWVDFRRLKSTRHGARHMGWLDAYGSAKKAPLQIHMGAFSLVKACQSYHGFFFRTSEGLYT